MKKIISALVFSLLVVGTAPAHAANEIRIVVTGPDADGITNIGYCFTDALALSGTVSYVASSSYGSFLAHSEMPNCPSMVGSSTGQRLTEGTTYVFTVTATNGGNTFTDTLNYTAPAQPAPRVSPSPTSTPAPDSSTVSTPPVTETVTAPAPTPTPTPTPTASTTSRIPYTQPCTGGSDRTPGLPQCLMPEGLGGSAWNLVDNNSGIVLNGAVCSEAVCGRNGEWRQWPADRKLNDRLWPTGFPEGATYIQTPFDGAYWGRYFTNGVYEVNGGGILQPGSKTIIWPVQTPPTPTVETRTVTSETSTSISTPPPVSDSVTTTSTPVVTPAPSSGAAPAPAPSSTPAPISAPTPTSETQSAVAPVVPIAPTSAVDPESDLDEVEAEEEIIDSIFAVIQSNGTTRIEVSTGYIRTAMTVVATKKGSKKKYTYKITTNADGDRKFKSGLNLRGYTLILYKGTTELDRMYIS
jgi:hypothetical protein